MANKKSLFEIMEQQNLKTKESYKSIQIAQILVDEANKKLIFDLTSETIIQDQMLDEINNQFKNQLVQFNSIEQWIKYPSGLLEKPENFALLSENIIYQIKQNIVSSRSWIDQFKLEKSEQGIIATIKVPCTEMIEMKQKQLVELVQNKIYNEFNIRLPFHLEIQNENEENHYENKANIEQALLKQLAIPEQKKPEAKKIKIEGDGDSLNVEEGYIYGKGMDSEFTKIARIDSNSGDISVYGEVFALETKEIKNGKKIYTFNMTDYSYSIAVKIFANAKQQELLDANLSNGICYKAKGEIIFDTFSRCLVLQAKSLFKTRPLRNRKDTAEVKRVELHCHTQMSDMDGMTPVGDIIKLAAKWGHPAIAITDHGVVQAFPDAMGAAKKNGIKALYGMEGYLVNDELNVVENIADLDLDNEYVVFDIETTGFSAVNNKIIEIGAVRLRNNQVVDTFSALINPQESIPLKITELTGIDDEMVRYEPTIETVLPKFYEYIQDTILVAHNASFDTGFIREKLKAFDLTLDNPILDTLQLSRTLLTDLKSFKLNKIAKYFNVSLENHHRAVDDATATAQIFIKLLEMLKDKDIKNLKEINTLNQEAFNFKTQRTYHIIILAQTEKGLKNLYQLVTKSHIEYFYRKPRILKSDLNKMRDGLILGTACEAGELFNAVVKGASEDELKDIVDFYDFLEIQPTGNNEFMLKNGTVNSIEELQAFNRKIVELGDIYNKPVVATGDVHFLNPEDEIFRRILMASKGFDDADNQPPLYLKTTDEMLEEFSYLGREKAYEVVVTNTNLIANQIESFLPIPDDTFPPVMEGSDDDLRRITYERAIAQYGDPLPEMVQSRLDRELNSIISNGYSVLYMIAQKLVKKSNDDGYLVGSRGSVGSSFVATMSGITEVNPLAPHYYCKSCQHSEFITDGSYGSGIDLPDKKCPKCGEIYCKDGHDIPFETFLGFEGDKEPDIDLNFAGPEQSVAHKYTEELFGTGYVYRAGTIGTIADKTAFGFVKKYYDEREKSVCKAEMDRLVEGCTGIKRTTGQHPGGVMVVPNYKDIHDFTPVQYPANDSSSGVQTTHFDYHSISGRILKLDILGHDTPYIIRMLETFTHTNAQDIPMDDKETMKIFLSTESIGVAPKDIRSEVGTYGIPEFGTKFVRQMLVDTQPTTFSELVQISGLSHGTDVWTNNAQDLVRNGITTLKNAISTRDDIMVYLIYQGLEKKLAFTIMEKVRKGKGLTPDDEAEMRKNNIPEWYIESCNKIKYMFPKAHAAAYVMMSFRIAYYKVHHPSAFYATYFTMKAADFDADLISKGKEAVLKKIDELEDLGNDKTAKEKNLLTVLEVALEMYCRDIKVLKADLYKSHSDEFLIVDKDILPPLKSLQGVGENAARNIVEARQFGEFISKEDIMIRSKASKTVIEALENHGCLKGMQEKNQMSLFDI